MTNPALCCRQLPFAWPATGLMKTYRTEQRCRRAIGLLALLCVMHGATFGQDNPRTRSAAEPTSSVDIRTDSTPTLEQLKSRGARQSTYRAHQPRSVATETPQPQLDAFRREVAPVLQGTCIPCHGPDTQEGNIRIDTLDPNLLHGEDVSWWLEVLAVLSKGEMPPADEAELSDEDRRRIIDWLLQEIQVASMVRRAEKGHSSFRRMTRYEYNYALQDLLGLPYHFAQDLPPDPISEDGFQNGSEMLHMSAIQFATYREISRNALQRATVRGDAPAPLYWRVPMEAASTAEWAKQDAQLEDIKEQHKDDAEKLQQELDRISASFQSRHNSAYYQNLTTGRTARTSWNYREAKHAWKPTHDHAPVPAEFNSVAILPPRQKLIVELGDQLPEEGIMRVRVRASRRSSEHRAPSLQLEFGWQASNDSSASVRISDHDLSIDAAPDSPEFYQWEIPMGEIYPRNLVRGISQLGDLPSPSEYVRFVNSSVTEGDVQLDYVEIIAPVHEQWPPPSHTRIFFDSENQADETAYAREVISRFMSRAWRRPVNSGEVDQKLALFTKIRPECDDFRSVMVEVLATVLSSPQFLYLVRSNPEDSPDQLSQDELAVRLSMFLWCSTPDRELLEWAAEGTLSRQEVLTEQVQRLLSDARSRRFSEHFVRQWLGMQLLDYLKVDRDAYPHFDRALKEAMQEEPIAFFHEVLQNNQSVLDFLHADYTMANERLASHYGLSDVYGNDFRRVPLGAP